MTSPPVSSASELRNRLEADFRHRVTAFYRSLRITPPYHSVEKARLTLRDTLKSLPESALREAAEDQPALDALFTQVFIESGLAKRSRGVIVKVLRDRPELLAPECRPFAEAFKAPP